MEVLKMMKNMKLSMKLSGGFGLIIIALIVVGGIGFLSIGGVQTIVSDLSETHMPLIDVIAEIDVTATEQELVVTQYALHGEEEFLTRYAELDKTVDEDLDKVKSLVEADQELVEKGWLENIKQIAEEHDAFAASCVALIKAIKENRPTEEWDPLADEGAKQSEAVMEHIDGFLEANDGESDRVGALAESTSYSARLTIGGVGLSAVIIGILLAFFITRGITRPINRIIEGLSEGADQVASASRQVSTSSQSLAEGASEQASSLEETSSSLEEMASMTKQNADNANQANTLMQEANQTVGKATGSMGQLTTSMEEISKASEETSKIIKTIDEIAFQTNLLALNAAVEAARAGEAGAGFAVVADEVRNLALRAADAAKNTAGLIEETIKKVKDGGEIVSKTNEAFTEVATSASKVGELVGEIAAASQEQSQGIENVNIAIAQMDKVTQSNAANAEESASASEEMNAQAEQMKGIVNELNILVSGSGTQVASRQYEVSREEKGAGTRVVGAGVKKAIAAPARKAPARKAKKREVTAQGKKEVKPDEVIPMEDEGDFKDF